MGLKFSSLPQFHSLRSIYTITAGEYELPPEDEVCRRFILAQLASLYRVESSSGEVGDDSSRYN